LTTIEANRTAANHGTQVRYNATLTARSTLWRIFLEETFANRATQAANRTR